MPLTLTVNGTERHFDALTSGSTMADFVQALGFRADRVAVEHNGAIVPRTTWTTHQLTADDKLEVVHFVGGGTHGRRLHTMGDGCTPWSASAH